MTETFTSFGDIKNLSNIVKDVLAGDETAYSKYLTNEKIVNIKKAVDFLLNYPGLSDFERVKLLSESWRLYFRDKPPTPTEFVDDYKYLGPVGKGTYDYIRQAFIDFLNPLKPHRNMILYTFISSGKSFLASLITIFIGLHLSMMRDPKKFFGLNPATVLTQLLISFTLSKSSETLLEPIINMLEVSPFFERVKFRESMAKKEKEFSRLSKINVIYWTTASPTAELTFSNSSHVKLGSSVEKLLGLTVVSGVCGELAFFRDAGWPDEKIMRLYTDLKRRVESRMKWNFYGRTILDSSPNDATSPIDHYCQYEAEKDELNYVMKGSRWKWRPYDFKDVNDTFPIFMGSEGKPPRILDPLEISSYSAETILQVPKQFSDGISVKALFKDDIGKSLKDIAGIPTSHFDKLFYDHSKIEDVFDSKLKNIYYHISANEKLYPEKLIWNKIKDELFIKIRNDKYQFYYKPGLPRVFHIDQSVSGDMAAIAVLHVEKIERGGIFIPLYIVDFTIVLSPEGGRINLDAIKYFIEDLLVEGGFRFQKGSYDTYQSEAAIQYLQRFGIDMTHISADKTVEPYLYMAQQIEQYCLKAGRSIYLKNNLKSLVFTKRPRTGSLKIDHTNGEPSLSSNTSWDTSTIGLHAKDVSDAVCGAVELARQNLLDMLRPNFETIIWNPDMIIPTEKDIEKRLKGFLDSKGFQVANII